MSNWLSFLSKNIIYLILRELNESCDSKLVNNLQREWDFYFFQGDRAEDFSLNEDMADSDARVSNTSYLKWFLP